MAKKSVKKTPFDMVTGEPLIVGRPQYDIATGMPIEPPKPEPEPEPEPEKSIEEKVEDEILRNYGDIPRGSTELYLRAILRELVRARIK